MRSSALHSKRPSAPDFFNAICAFDTLFCPLYDPCGMEQPRDSSTGGLKWLILAVFLLIAGGLALKTQIIWVHFAHPSPSRNIPSAHQPTIASLTPAGTDIVIGMGASS